MLRDEHEVHKQLCPLMEVGHAGSRADITVMAFQIEPLLVVIMYSVCMRVDDTYGAHA
jgi:hypothetical protein